MGWTRLRAKFLLALIPPAFFLLLEAGLALGGVRPLYLEEDPYVGFAPGQPLFVPMSGPDGRLWMATNPAKLTHFNLQRFPLEKPPGTFRIFALGGSATYGHPWRDPTSYSGWLRELLPFAEPGRRWEVINAGGISYASYREVRLAEELVRYAPDLFVVYCGHNEFLEERTYRGIARLPEWLRTASARLDRTRTYTVLRRAVRALRPGPEERLPGEVEEILNRTYGPASYRRDDDLRDRVHAHYRASLERLAALAGRAGAQVLFVDTPANERDCSPFKSEPTPGLDSTGSARVRAAERSGAQREEAGDFAAALEEYRSALRLDPRNAGLLFRAGRAAAVLGHPEAKTLLSRAVDEDVCPLRATTALRSIARETAAATGMLWLDFADTLEAWTRRERGHALLGEPDFVDHVHLSVEGYRTLALCIADRMEQAGLLRTVPGWKERALPAVAAFVEKRFDDGERGLGLHNLAKVLNWAGKHAEAVRIGEMGLRLDSISTEAAAVSLFVGHWHERAGRPEALAHYRRAVAIDPDNARGRRALGMALLRSGDPVGAGEQMRAALELRPDDAKALKEMGAVRLAIGDLQAAADFILRSAERDPGDAETFQLLGEAFLARDPSKAAAAFARALELEPENLRARTGLERVRQDGGI